MEKVTKLISNKNMEKLPIHSHYWEFMDFIPDLNNSLKHHTSSRLNKNISRMLNFKNSINNE